MSFVGEPGCNGVVERFIRTLKEAFIDAMAKKAA